MSEALEPGLVIGVDVGGTKVAAGLVDATGTILYQNRTPMVANDGSAGGLTAVRAAIDSVSRKATSGPGAPQLIQGIGICAPGPLDPKTGTILNPPNLPCWRDYPLAAEIARIYRVRVKVDNDANAAGLAEIMWGAGRGHNDAFYATLGTGIGTAIIIGGRVYEGRTGAAGEGGHMSIDYKGPLCGCGKRGCIEAFASGPAIAKRARAKLEKLPTPRLLELASGEIAGVSSEMVGAAYSAGDATATETLREIVDLLAVWLGNMIDLLEPEVIIMGGGVSTMLQPFFQEITDRVPDYCVNPGCRDIRLVPAKYGADSGIAGGAALCFQPGASIKLETSPQSEAVSAVSVLPGRKAAD
jgi:glucokinase